MWAVENVKIYFCGGGGEEGTFTAIFEEHRRGSWFNCSDSLYYYTYLLVWYERVLYYLRYTVQSRHL